MAPCDGKSVSLIKNAKSTNQIDQQNMDTQKIKQPAMQIVWTNVMRITLLHIAAVYGAYLLPWAHYYTWIWTVFLYYPSCFGITAGAHRLWSHRSYKARTPLRVLLAICNTLSLQNDLIEWVRDHRVHHKFSETDADPHNATRGFFFAHCGWLMVRKHPDVKAKGKTIDMSDMLNDPVCVIQRKVYVPASILLGFVLPAIIPWYFWNERLSIAFFVCSILRYVLVLNFTWLVNSAGHIWGMKPYDKSINPAENLMVTLCTSGEGFHNYHHTFPQDYATSEFGWRLNPTTMFIDLMAALGQVTYRNKTSSEVVEKRKRRTGDISNGLRYCGLF